MNHRQAFEAANVKDDREAEKLRQLNTELLEALRLVADMLEYPSSQLTDTQWRDSAVRCARAAISKAEGGAA